MKGYETVDVYGDPSYWQWWPMRTAESDSFNLAQCPQCGAAVLNVYQHKAWHLQNDAKAEGK